MFLSFLVIRAVALRHSSHKPAVPVNEPPNDHLPFKVATIDDLPAPEGDYYEDFQKRNRRYWMHFFGGVSFLAVALYVVSSKYQHIRRFEMKII